MREKTTNWIDVSRSCQFEPVENNRQYVNEEKIWNHYL